MTESPRSWRSIIGTLLMPWAIVFLVYDIGLHWTVIALAACFVVALLISIGEIIGENRK